MMEGMNQAGQEEYIWAMRTSAYRDDESELWKERRSAAYSQMHIPKSKSLGETSIDQTKTMASLVPDEVINNVNDYSHRQYDACFLFGDVSGFTELCEKYTKTGVSGPSRMTQVLNKYLGSMVQEIMSHNGDVLKFSGDAFLAMYKTSESETMRDAVHEALDSALVIQKSYGSYLTDVGVVIRVKLALSAGVVTFALIGTETTSHYVVVGKPIWDVKAAESISSAGDIVVAPAAWHYVSTNEYVFKEMPDNTHVKIVGVGPNWRSVQKGVRHQHKQDVDDTVSISSSSESDESDFGETQDLPTEEFSLRPAVNKAARFKIKESLRKFIIAPVMKSIDKGEPFEYLTEMRQAVVVFINVVSTKLETRETVILADQTYKIVCRVVDKMKGCVNKVSLFDKDLMFLVIFGLRGLKHELECQVALRCAKECHETINKLNGVLTTSIGVTTGKTYCGVFGHALRREYTVISLIVNKAARLMVAYKNKVTCDRETFLHSKLEARHFVLQEHKYLKGISHPGPIYEFKETEIDHNEIQRINACPFLGRSDKLEIFTKLLQRCRNSSRTSHHPYKMMLIQGVARQGKTRLLDEIVYVTPQDIPVNRFTLTRGDLKIPYQTMRLVFNLPLGLTTNPSTKRKEQTLLEALKRIQVPDLMCVLNSMFGVKFKISNLYLSLNEESRKNALRKMVKQLCYVCFPSLWVLAIDDCENIDNESWDIFDVLFEIRTIFVVATMGRDKGASSESAQRIISDNRVKIVVLTPIPKMYLAALACQILDVYAISPELENAIQIRSNGNPGWIESFLLSLYQDDGFYILKASLKECNDLGLVVPPLYMMARLTEDEKLKWQKMMEERNKTLAQAGEEDIWSSYIECCRDSYMNVTIREQLEVGQRGDKVPICVISPTFEEICQGEAEMSMDSMILKTFDSLTFFEQLLVKCSAILGNQFPRDMLLYVMSATDKRKAALAVQKLFDIKVLTCAKGDFVEGGALVFRERLLNPVDDTGLVCQCKGLKIHETCMDLPRYANCGYLQFRSSLFRDITYNLLTDNQKKEFHQRAIRYLERETRKCRACGNGLFDRILGPRQDKEFLITRDRQINKKSSSASYGSLSISIRRTSGHSVATTTSTGSASKKSKLDDKSILSYHTNASIRSQLFGENKGEKAYKAIFGFTIINKLKQSFSLTRAFSSEDFTDCQCLQILSTTYAQLIDHCLGADELTKQLEAMLEYAQISIILYNIPLALKILIEALDVLSRLSRQKTEHLWKLSLVRGKVFTLIGCSRIELGLFQAAFKILHRSLFEYGITFPKGVRAQLKVWRQQFKQFFGFYIFPNVLMKHFDHWETVYSNNLAECLSHLCTLYMKRGQWREAEVAATWSLTKALESFSDFQIICVACANMLFIAQHFKRWKLCIALEIHSLRLCHLKRTAVDAGDLKCVAKLYTVIFASRLSRSSVDKAIHIGYIVLRMCASIKAIKTILPVLPLLAHALIYGNHFNNTNSILQELDYFSNQDADSSGKIWYYALCITIQIETAYTVVPYNVCEQIFQIEGESWLAVRDPDARKRFFTVMWLWCVRNEKWEDATIWCLKTSDFMVLSTNDSLSNKFTALYLLEGLIIYLVSKLDKRNIKAVIRAESEIKYLIKMLDVAAKSTSVIQPRLAHLKAYFKYVKNNDVKVTHMMTKAKKIAEKCGNLLEAGWIEHNLKAWSRSLPVVLVDFWKDHVEPDSLLDFQDLEVSEGKVGFYTLPIPVYI